MPRENKWKPPKCSSRKAAFRTQGRALAALRTIARDNAQAAAPGVNPPVREYKCEECGAWHLTSQP